MKRLSSTLVQQGKHVLHPLVHAEPQPKEVRRSQVGGRRDLCECEQLVRLQRTRLLVFGADSLVRARDHLAEHLVVTSRQHVRKGHRCHALGGLRALRVPGRQAED
eukprot:scaffold7375_cov268-Pinguiococcus_pyrenoidosus.AAC.5